MPINVASLHRLCVASAFVLSVHVLHVFNPSSIHAGNLEILSSLVLSLLSLLSRSSPFCSCLLCSLLWYCTELAQFLISRFQQRKDEKEKRKRKEKERTRKEQKSTVGLRTQPINSTTKLYTGNLLYYTNIKTFTTTASPFPPLCSNYRTVPIPRTWFTSPPTDRPDRSSERKPTHSKQARCELGHTREGNG